MHVSVFQAQVCLCRGSTHQCAQHTDRFPLTSWQLGALGIEVQAMWVGGCQWQWWWRCVYVVVAVGEEEVLMPGGCNR